MNGLERIQLKSRSHIAFLGDLEELTFLKMYEWCMSIKDNENKDKSCPKNVSKGCNKSKISQNLYFLNSQNYAKTHRRSFCYM